MMVQVEGPRDPRRIQELKKLIDDEDYLADAVRRIAQVVSDELLGVARPGATHERRR